MFILYTFFGHIFMNIILYYYYSNCIEENYYRLYLLNIINSYPCNKLHVYIHTYMLKDVYNSTTLFCLRFNFSEIEFFFNSREFAILNILVKLFMFFRIFPIRQQLFSIQRPCMSECRTLGFSSAKGQCANELSLSSSPCAI